MTFGPLLMMGFQGTSSNDEGVRQVSEYIEAGLLGGIILFSHNINASPQLLDLITFFRGLRNGHDLLVAVDQEGGKVQRLSSKNGFFDTPSPKQVSEMSMDQAEALYERLALLLKDHGINFNFAPGVDLAFSKSPSPIIGRLERSFGDEVSEVVERASCFIKAHRLANVLTSLKHYPGHGSAKGDTHEGFVDVTSDWTEKEKDPFIQLINASKADSVMVAHTFNERFDNKFPASLSEKTLRTLRRNYKGVMVGDDFHMGAINRHFAKEEVVLNAFHAGLDLLIFSNNPAAAKGEGAFCSDPHLPAWFHEFVQKAIQSSDLDGGRLKASLGRIQKLKERIRGDYASTA